MVFVCCGGVKIRLTDLWEYGQALESLNPQDLRRINMDGENIELSDS